MVTRLRPGEPIRVRALRADGRAYRWWQDRIEAIDAEQVVAVWLPGRVVHGPRGWVSAYAGRQFYWFRRPFNLAEIYRTDGTLLEIYVHIASPARLRGRQLVYTDHELDVVCKPGSPPELFDEDEFAEAAQRYGYSAEFQAACYRAVAEAVELVRGWEPRGAPTTLLSPQARRRGGNVARGPVAAGDDGVNVPAHVEVADDLDPPRL